jgi:hypothetical protein
MMLEDAQSYVRVRNIYNLQNFDRSLRPVVKFGNLATLLTIMQARETSKIKIELQKKNFVKQAKK